VANAAARVEPEQIAEFQAWFDTSRGQHRRAPAAALRPGRREGAAAQAEGDALKDEFDEWLARIICYCFSLSPQALVKQMNRATAQTAKQSAQEEGLEPLKNWFKDLSTRC
jgi:hypothetical protein